MSPAGLHNSRERGGWSTPQPRSRSSSPSRSRELAESKDRESQRRSRDICRRYAPAADARGSPTPDFFPPEFRGHNKTTVLPAGLTAILSPPLSLSLSLCPLHAPSSFVHHQFQLVVFLPSPCHPPLPLVFFSPTSKNQCDVTCALTPGSSGVPTELSLSPFSLLPESSKLPSPPLLPKYINSRIHFGNRGKEGSFFSKEIK